MREVVLQEPRSLEVREAAEPAAAGDALVRLRYAGICGSDLSAYRGRSSLVSYPRVLGHELLVDVEVAPSRPELIGRRAVVEPLMPCGRCRVCRAGRYNCCPELQVLGVHVDGGLRELMPLATAQLFEVPDGMSDEMAVLAEPVSIAYRAVQRSGIDAGKTAVILGAGAIGLLVAQLLLNGRGCRVVFIDIDQWRLQIAGAVGAITLSGSPADLITAVAEITEGCLADVVFEATGNPSCTRLTTDLVAHTGRIVLIGWNQGPVEVDTVSLMRKEAEIVGSRNSTGAFPAILQLLGSSIIDASLMITHRFPLAEAPKALELLDRGERALKILVAGR